MKIIVNYKLKVAKNEAIETSFKKEKKNLLCLENLRTTTQYLCQDSLWAKNRKQNLPKRSTKATWCTATFSWQDSSNVSFKSELRLVIMHRDVNTYVKLPRLVRTQYNGSSVYLNLI